MIEELHTEEEALTEPEATTSDVSKPQVRVIFVVKGHFRVYFIILTSLYVLIGGRILLHYIKKSTKGTGMQGVKVARPNDFRRMTSSKRTVTRPYGGILTGGEVIDRIKRAFLIEEFKRFKNINMAKTEKKDKKKKKKTDDKKKTAKK